LGGGDRIAPGAGTQKGRDGLLDRGALLESRLLYGGRRRAAALRLRGAGAPPHPRLALCEQPGVGPGDGEDRHGSRRAAPRTRPQVGRVPRSRGIRGAGGGMARAQNRIGVMKRSGVGLAILLVCALGCASHSTPKSSAEVPISITDDGFEPARSVVPKGTPLTLVFTRKSDQTCVTDV